MIKRKQGEIKIERKKDMLTLEDAIPCSVCGAKPILQGGNRSGRLVCPNYKSKKILHGNLDANRNGLIMGFSHWNHYFWTKEQREKEGIPTAVSDWNYIQKNRIDNCNFKKMKKENRNDEEKRER